MFSLPFIRNCVQYFEQSSLPPLTYQSSHSVISGEYNDIEARQRKVAAVVLGIFACLAVCYAIYHCYFKSKRFSFSTNQKLKDALPEENQERLGGISLLNHLPTELWVDIFNRLDIRSWNNLSLTNQDLLQLSRHPKVLLPVIEKYNFSIKFSPYTKILLGKKIGSALTKLDLKPSKIWENSQITDCQLEDLLNNCPNIQELDLSRCEQLTNAVISKLPQNLRILHLASCSWVTEITINMLSQGLQILNLRRCKGIRGAAITQFPPNLQACDLTDTNTSIDKLPSNLKKLHLSYCNQLTDNDMDKLPKSLQMLSLRGCNITDAAIDKLPPKFDRKRKNIIQRICLICKIQNGSLKTESVPQWLLL